MSVGSQVHHGSSSPFSLLFMDYVYLVHVCIAFWNFFGLAVSLAHAWKRCHYAAQLPRGLCWQPKKMNPVKNRDSPHCCGVGGI